MRNLITSEKNAFLFILLVSTFFSKIGAKFKRKICKIFSCDDLKKSKESNIFSKTLENSFEFVLHKKAKNSSCGPNVSGFKMKSLFY